MGMKEGFCAYRTLGASVWALKEGFANIELWGVSMGV